MRLEDYLEQVRHQLDLAAALGDERTQQVATALGEAITPAVRLAILGALATAADEMTTALLEAPGAPAVSMHLDGDEVRAEVRFEPATASTPPATPEDEDSSARISLRLPESLKAQVDSAARSGGVSVNSWLVRAVAAAVAGSSPASPATPWPGAARHQGVKAHRVTGWINS